MQFYAEFYVLTEQRCLSFSLYFSTRRKVIIILFSLRKDLEYDAGVYACKRLKKTLKTAQAPPKGVERIKVSSTIIDTKCCKPYMKFTMRVNIYTDSE